MSKFLNISEEFLARYAAALRMEPDSRTTDLANGIAVRIADPLWFLTRQWQVSEFEGEDAGSPIDVSLLCKMRPLKSVKLRNDDGVVISDDNSPVPDSIPLEKLVEQEWLDVDWKMSARIGQEFERQIFLYVNNDVAALYIENYRNAYPFKFDNADQESRADKITRQLVDFMKGRVVDGRAILGGLDFSSNSLTLDSGNLTEQYRLGDTILSDIASYLVRWCNSMNIKKSPERSRAWRNEQLDYRFTLEDGDNDSNQGTLVAPEYRSGDLDWYTFDSCDGLHTSGIWLDHALTSLLPTPINITGISRRWWEFEDANIDLGHMEVGKVDIARGILMQYALVYGDDWYSIPLPIPVSHLAKIDSLKVYNVFGQEESIDPAYYHVNQHVIESGGDPADPMQQWRIFTLSPTDRTSVPGDMERPLLYIPPVLSLNQESDPLEEARFVRDEWSNMVWCIEQTVLNGIGKPVDGYKAQLEYFESVKENKIEQLIADIDSLKSSLAVEGQRPEDYQAIRDRLELANLELRELSPENADEDATLPYYRLATSVPENWIPFKPFDARIIFGGDRNIRLRRAQMLRNTFNEKPEPIQARTRLLEISGNPLLWLEENVIPRSGLRICLINQRTRWIDGQTFVWKSRKILTGRGEGQSGLIFDKLFNL